MLALLQLVSALLRRTRLEQTSPRSPTSSVCCEPPATVHEAAQLCRAPSGHMEHIARLVAGSSVAAVTTVVESVPSYLIACIMVLSVVLIFALVLVRAPPILSAALRGRTRSPLFRGCFSRVRTAARPAISFALSPRDFFTCAVLASRVPPLCARASRRSHARAPPHRARETRGTACTACAARRPRLASPAVLVAYREDAISSVCTSMLSGRKREAFLFAESRARRLCHARRTARAPPLARSYPPSTLPWPELQSHTVRPRSPWISRSTTRS